MITENDYFDWQPANEAADGLVAKGKYEPDDLIGHILTTLLTQSRCPQGFSRLQVRGLDIGVKAYFRMRSDEFLIFKPLPGLETNPAKIRLLAEAYPNINDTDGCIEFMIRNEPRPILISSTNEEEILLRENEILRIAPHVVREIIVPPHGILLIMPKGNDYPPVFLPNNWRPYVT